MSVARRAWACGLWLWRAALTALAPLLALIALHPRLRPRARERLGFPVPTAEPGAVWIHAASLGENKVADVLAAELRRVRPDLAILRTATSPTALAQGHALAPPLDAPPFVAAWLDRVRPRLLILVEAELWPCLLAGCRARAIPVVVVQARVGPGLRRVRRWAGAWEALTAGVRFLAADNAVGDLLGVPVTGDMKREAEAPPPVLQWDRPALVAGSTHPGEEAALLDAIAGLAPRPLLILAPRAPSRFAEVRALAAAHSRSIARSALLPGSRVADDVDVVVLDTIGELAGLYAQADVAFVGGTFIAAVGGHSPAEATGCVIVAGPERHASAGAWEGLGVVDAARPQDLAAALRTAFAGSGRPPPVRPTFSAAARTVAALGPELDAPIPDERPLRPWLWPLGWAWLAAVQLRPAPLERAAVPVIAVGGLTAGGSGKTPVAGWLAAELAASRPVVLSRGYGRAPGADLREGADAQQVGDELAMLAARGIRVASSPDRATALRALLARPDPPGCAILDDAFQYRGLARDVEIVVIDARWPEGGGPIPVGLRRAPLAWLRRADVVWVNHGALPERLAPYVRADAVRVTADYAPAGWIQVTADGARAHRPLAEGPVGPFAAFAGIARPASFLATLRTLGLHPATLRAWPDHHRFDDADAAELRALAERATLLTTEKDLARLPRGIPAWALRVEPRLSAGEADLRALLQRRGSPGA